MSDAARFRRMAAECEPWVSEQFLPELAALLARVDREARAEERERCALIADAVSMGRPDNRQALVPRAAYRAGARKVAWRIRQGDIADAAAEQRDTGGADTEAGEHREGGDHG